MKQMILPASLAEITPAQLKQGWRNGSVVWCGVVWCGEPAAISASRAMGFGLLGAFRSS
jgi:hypothetical protein